MSEVRFVRRQIEKDEEELTALRKDEAELSDRFREAHEIATKVRLIVIFLYRRHVVRTYLSEVRYIVTVVCRVLYLRAIGNQ